jgi:hypothetical protein
MRYQVYSTEFSLVVLETNDYNKAVREVNRKTHYYLIDAYHPGKLWSCCGSDFPPPQINQRAK